MDRENSWSEVAALQDWLERQQRQSEVAAVLRQVPAEAVGDRVQQAPAREREPRRDHEVRQVGGEDERRVDATRLEAGERGDHER